jgi:hypothetical protein
LERAPVPRPACWFNGTRIPNRNELVDALDYRGAGDPVEVIIIQPHISERRYMATKERKNSGAHSEDVLRLKLLDTLLLSARGTVITFGADLHVIGSKA